MENLTEKTHKIKYDENTIRLHKLYDAVRIIRGNSEGFDKLGDIFTSLKNNHDNDWLLVLEIFEILKKNKTNPELMEEMNVYLSNQMKEHPEFERLIKDGLGLIN